MQYDVKFFAYCGLAVPLESSTDRKDARSRAARYIRAARDREAVVSIIERGERWEVQTLANIEGLCISDEDGVLVITGIAENEDETPDDWYDGNEDVCFECGEPCVQSGELCDDCQGCADDPDGSMYDSLSDEAQAKGAHSQ